MYVSKRWIKQISIIYYTQLIIADKCRTFIAYITIHGYRPIPLYKYLYNFRCISRGMSQKSRVGQFAAICSESSRYWFILRGENLRSIARPSSLRIREMCGFRMSSTVYYQIKNDAILNMKSPEDITGVQRLCGLVQYIARLLPDLSDIHELLRKLGWTLWWSIQKCEKTVDRSCGFSLLWP